MTMRMHSNGSISKSNFLCVFDYFLDLLILVCFNTIAIDFYSIKCFNLSALIMCNFNVYNFTGSISKPEIYGCMQIRTHVVWLSWFE